MEYYGNTLCISARELVDSGVMTHSNYCQLVARKKMTVVRRGGGSSNCYALVAVSSLPDTYREKVNSLYPDPSLEVLLAWLEANYETDQAAVAYFMEWRNRCGAAGAKDTHVTEYVTNASVLNACIRLYNNAKAIHKTMGLKYDWAMMAQAVEGYRQKTGHTLPSSMLRFRKKVTEYQREGYACLISGKFGNQSSRKVDHKAERLVLSIAALPNQPYGSDVHEMYIQFLCTELDVWDLQTGELFNPDDFTDRDGNPKELSESTIRNILNKPSNHILLEKARLDRMDFYHEQMPHVHRHSGEFSLSQITMDDVDLSRRMKGNEYVHAYYAYDMVSQCRIGLAYSRKKDDDLVVECFRDMFRFIDRHGWGMPAAIEVEQHLMSKYKDGFLRAGEVFRFVRFCAPQNSQDKYAEPLNGAFKTTIAHKNHEGIGRWYNKGARRTSRKKISDENNHTYQDRQYYSYEELVADDRRDCAEWNNTLHPNQKKYPGMTRLQVLESNLNPTLLPLDHLTLSRYIGERVETSIRRNSTVRVAHEDWWLSGPEILEKLEPNNRKLTAYYLPDEEGKPTEVYLYQGDRYIDKAERVETFNRCIPEQTDDDRRIFTEQMKRMSHFRKYLDDNAIVPVGAAKPETYTCTANTVELLPPPKTTDTTEPDTAESYDWHASDTVMRAIGDA